MKCSTKRALSTLGVLPWLLLAACAPPPESRPVDLSPSSKDGAIWAMDGSATDGPGQDASADGELAKDATGEEHDAVLSDMRRREGLEADAPPSPAHEVCASPREIKVDSTATSYLLRGDTSYASDEFSKLNCLAQKADGNPLMFSGPQTYYVVTLPKGSWELNLATEGWTGLFYAAPWPEDTGCSEAELNQACAHLWSTNQLLIGVTDDTKRWLIAVDSLAYSQRGVFQLTFTRHASATNARCEAPALLTLNEGSVSVTTSTHGASDDFSGISCGLNAPEAFRGAQLYYSVTLLPKKTYKLSIASEVDLALYAFGAPTACDKAAIDAGCKDRFSDKAANGHETLLLVTGDTEETYTVVVDSYAARAFGTFTLRVQEFIEAPNTRCAVATPVSLSSLPTAVSGDTTTVANEFVGIGCGLGTAFDAGQLYYALDLLAGQTYRVTARALTFDAGLYAFPSTTGCEPTAINNACAQQTEREPLAVDNFSGIKAMSPETLHITPPTDGRWIVAVDALSPDEAGVFTLEIDAYTAPNNSRCTQADVIRLSEDAALLSISGDTSAPGIVDEFPTIQCAKSLPDPMKGPQLYYRLFLEAGRTYQISLVPHGWDGALYAFPATTECNAAAIDAACGAGSGGLLSSDNLGPNVKERLVVVPTTDTDWIFAVDSFSSSAPLGFSAGSFTLLVE
ncbi:MAG: hypothetical protein JRH20_10385 [Deltaproteobacteria bacterium]|nr:hypothetical protein [Deltaproteobacteria bacterium]